MRGDETSKRRLGPAVYENSSSVCHLSVFFLFCFFYDETYELRSTMDPWRVGKDLKKKKKNIQHSLPPDSSTSTAR